MVSNSINDQARIALASVGSAGRAAVQYALRSPVSRWLSGPPAAHHLLIVPQELRTADPSFASELNDGYFGLAGAVALTGSESPFTVTPPTPAWQRELFSFCWLRHLHAADDDVVRERARALVAEWMALGGSAPRIAWDEDVAARRVIALFSHAGFLLEDVDAEFYDAFMRALTVDLHNLSVTGARGAQGLPKLRTQIALLFAALCVAEQQTALPARLASFQAELAAQILPDGGHVSRNPGCLVELLLDLLPLKQCFIARKIDPPQFLYDAVNRMLPMLRFMRLGAGLGRFNGMGATPLDFLASVLVYHDEPWKPRVHAEASGYARLERGATAVLMDVGGPPSLMSSAGAHAGCLSFEMASEGELIVVNCGAPRDAGSEWGVVCRSTAAHSTLTINDASSSKLVRNQLSQDREAHLLSGPRTVRCEVGEENGAVVVRAAHDGYRDRFNLTHRRRIALSADGMTLEGLDQLVGPSGKAAFTVPNAGFAIRFHLAPGVAAMRMAEPGGVMLALPNGELWRFAATGAQVNIEESIFLADLVGPRRSLQIVLTGPCSSETQAAWTLARAGRQAQPRAKSESDLLEIEHEEEGE
ncbi:MAG: heparinase II/III family protein [Hyphomicrobiales bacterium]|nr:heparinase II/III family protein [Hyphomicrobiales bacterium]